MIEEGDLVISTLHTQKGNGLFAYSDSDYVAASQIVVKVKEGVNKEWIVLMLRMVLPLLKSNDLVGRETYSKETILSLPIEYPVSKEALDILDKEVEITKLQKDNDFLLMRMKERFKCHNNMISVDRGNS